MEKNLLDLLLLGQQKADLQIIKECNQYTQRFGLMLSDTNVLDLLHSRREVLKEEERIEFQGGILSKLIYEFCDSPYIYQDNYVDTLEELQRIFYLYKNESLDELSDDELITFMKAHFDGICQGSLEHLEDTCLYQLCRKGRSGYRYRDLLEE